MLTPSKHLNLDTSVLRVSAIMLKELKKRGIVEFERLRSVVLKRVGPDGDVAFMPSLSFWPDPSRCSEPFVRLGGLCGGVHAATL
ncbi:MAG: hypothetical protein CMI63_18470 [Parvularcula sp.]|nr:hypothetical protein [Parvularcula sp.]